MVASINRSRLRPRAGRNRPSCPGGDASRLWWRRWLAMMGVALAIGWSFDSSAARRGRKGTLQIECSVDGAEVWVDGKLLGTTPLQAQTVAAGRRRVVVRKDNYASFSKRVTVRAGRSIRLAVELQAVNAPPPEDLPGLDLVPLAPPPPDASSETAPAPGLVAPPPLVPPPDDPSKSTADAEGPGTELTPIPGLVAPPPDEVNKPTSIDTSLTQQVEPSDPWYLSPWFLGGTAAVVTGAVVAGFLLANSGDGTPAETPIDRVWAP